MTSKMVACFSACSAESPGACSWSIERLREFIGGWFATEQGERHEEEARDVLEDEKMNGKGE
jgi:hypothetical protein